MVRAAWMEKIMTKTGNASQDRELQDSEPVSVFGGALGGGAGGIFDMFMIGGGGGGWADPPWTLGTNC
jgi:hypothetical protein